MLFGYAPTTRRPQRHQCYVRQGLRLCTYARAVAKACGAFLAAWLASSPPWPALRVGLVAISCGPMLLVVRGCGIVARVHTLWYSQVQVLFLFLTVILVRCNCLRRQLRPVFGPWDIGWGCRNSLRTLLASALCRNCVRRKLRVSSGKELCRSSHVQTTSRFQAAMGTAARAEQEPSPQ